MQPSEFLKMGIAVIPLYPKSKKPMIKWQKYQTILPTVQEFNMWFRPTVDNNAAVICGWQGLTVLDFDNTLAYCAWLAWAIAQGGEARRVAAESYRVKTSRGMHVYVFVDDTLSCGKFQHGDIKGKRGYVLIPPSVHPSGAVYTVVDDLAPILRVGCLGDVIADPPPEPIEQLPEVVNVYPTSNLWPLGTVEEIKQRVSILSYFPSARQSGQAYYKAGCPFHTDSNPSFWIDLGKGICGCYAGCTGNKPIDVIGLHARLHGISNQEAIKELAG